jgi:hypothetical protein
MHTYQIKALKFGVIVSCAAVLLRPGLGAAQEGGSCGFLCGPELKIEPTISFENLGNRARVEIGGVVEETEQETVFELIFALGVSTGIPWIGLTFEVGVAPFAGTSEHPFTGVTAEELGRDDIRANLVVIENELNLYLIDFDKTGGWLSSHFDIVDKFSPGVQPGATSAYTHKLNFELDTALHPLNSLTEGGWLGDVEAEISIDYVATGLPRAGDLIGDALYLDDASPWSVSIALVLLLAPLGR